LEIIYGFCDVNIGGKVVALKVPIEKAYPLVESYEGDLGKHTHQTNRVPGNWNSY